MPSPGGWGKAAGGRGAAGRPGRAVPPPGLGAFGGLFLIRCLAFRPRHDQRELRQGSGGERTAARGLTSSLSVSSLCILSYCRLMSWLRSSSALPSRAASTRSFSFCRINDSSSGSRAAAAATATAAATGGGSGGSPAAASSASSSSRASSKPAAPVLLPVPVVPAGGSMPPALSASAGAEPAAGRGRHGADMALRGSPAAAAATAPLRPPRPARGCRCWAGSAAAGPRLPGSPPQPPSSSAFWGALGGLGRERSFCTVPSWLLLVRARGGKAPAGRYWEGRGGAQRSLPAASRALLVQGAALQAFLLGSSPLES